MLFDDHVLRAITSAVSAATIDPEPMAHVVIQNALPTDAFRAIVHAIPDRSLFRFEDELRQNLRPGDEGLPSEPLAVWRRFEREVVGSHIAPALLAKFGSHLDAYYGATYGRNANAVRALPHGIADGRIMVRRPGYTLNAHRDKKRVVITGLLYLSGDVDEDHGTTLYRPDQDFTPRSWGSTFFLKKSGIGCSPVKTVPYRANTLLAFVNLGAHGGAYPKGSAPDHSERISYQFYVAPCREALLPYMLSDVAREDA